MYVCICLMLAFCVLCLPFFISFKSSFTSVIFCLYVCEVYFLNRLLNFFFETNKINFFTFSLNFYKRSLSFYIIFHGSFTLFLVLLWRSFNIVNLKFCFVYPNFNLMSLDFLLIIWPSMSSSLMGLTPLSVPFILSDFLYLRYHPFRSFIK